MDTFPFPLTWDRVGLEALGFEGFVPFGDIRAPRVMRLPTDNGLYVVLRRTETPPVFLPSSPAKGSLYSTDELAAAWVDATPVLYIGKAGPVGGIHKRVKQYARRGKSHTGGRSIWQLADADELVVAWSPTPGELGRDVERRWIARFVELFGARPFANRAD